jgi:NAD(P)H-dependent flavin oxidoreductase YrpB (nitropropane dioxygenase family)
LLDSGQGAGGFAFPQPASHEKHGHLKEDKPIPSTRYPLLTLIPDCVKAISELMLESPPFIVAAGGITTGEDISKCLELGAEAVVVSLSYKTVLV